MPADYCKPADVSAGVLVKGVEDLRMQVWSDVDRPERPASPKAAKVWPPDLKGEKDHAMWSFSTRSEGGSVRAAPGLQIVLLKPDGRPGSRPAPSIHWVHRPIHWPVDLAAGEARRLSRPHCYIRGLSGTDNPGPGLESPGLVLGACLSRRRWSDMNCD